MPYFVNPDTGDLEYKADGGGGGTVDGILTDDGAPAVAPDGGNDISILGGTGIDVTGNGPGSTVTISATGTVTTTFDADTGSASPALNVINLVGGTNGIDTTATGSTVTFNFDVSEQPTIPTSITADTGTVTPATNAFSVVGSGGVSTSGAGSTLTITAGGTVATTYTADTGSATPTLNNLDVLGSGSIATSGATDTLTIALSGLTDHAVLIGAGTSTITKVGPVASTGAVLQSNGLSSDPGFSTATYPSTTTVSEILYSSATNTVTGLATANSSVLTTTAAGVPVLTALATDGQLIIGSTAGAPAAASLASADSSITITGGSNTIDLVIAGGTTVGKTLTADSGGALSPTAGNWTIAGGTGITTAGAGSTVTINLDSPVAATNGGTAQSTYATGDVLYASATNTLSKLTAGTDGEVLTLASGVPSWAANGGGDVTGPGSSTDNALVRFDGTTGKIIQNGVITEDNTGNLSQAAAVSGGSLSVVTTNSSNTASATAYHEVEVAGSTASDAYFRAKITSGQNWTWGLDNSESDGFALAASSDLGTTNVITSTISGEVNIPLQPYFNVYVSSTIADVTGDGTNYVVIYDSETTDIGSNFNTTTGVFTAPVTGNYLFTHNLRLENCTSSVTIIKCYIFTTAKYYETVTASSANRDSSDILIIQGCVIVPMTAADTAYIQVGCSGTTKTVDVSGLPAGSTRVTHWQGALYS